MNKQQMTPRAHHSTHNRTHLEDVVLVCHHCSVAPNGSGILADVLCRYGIPTLKTAEAQTEAAQARKFVTCQTQDPIEVCGSPSCRHSPWPWPTSKTQAGSKSEESGNTSKHHQNLGIKSIRSTNTQGRLHPFLMSAAVFEASTSVACKTKCNGRSNKYPRCC